MSTDTPTVDPTDRNAPAVDRYAPTVDPTNRDR